jgi:hypothetical protein
MASRTRTGLFCLEGSWENLLTDRSSVRPLLEVLQGRGIIEFAHRDAVTVEEFERYLRQWSQKQYQRLSVGYLAFHGSPGHLVVGRTRYSLEQLGELLEDRLADRILYFGSCGTPDVDSTGSKPSTPRPPPERSAATPKTSTGSRAPHSTSTSSTP